MYNLDMDKILIIDDDEDYCTLMTHLLRHDGYRIATCTDSTKAYTKTLEFKPDLILLDLNMPLKSGDEIAAELKSDHKTKDIPVIFVTALVRKQESTRRDHRIGERVMLSKKVDIEEMRALIKTTLGK